LIQITLIFNVWGIKFLNENLEFLEQNSNYLSCRLWLSLSNLFHINSNAALHLMLFFYWSLRIALFKKMFYFLKIIVVLVRTALKQWPYSWLGWFRCEFCTTDQSFSMRLCLSHPTGSFINHVPCSCLLVLPCLTSVFPYWSSRICCLHLHTCVRDYF
jgi:hypothetical protein